jgi:hypothetical protein
MLDNMTIAKINLNANYMNNKGSLTNTFVKI